MKRKNMISMVTSLALVGVVAVGGTLALLTSQTKQLTNTFTVGEDYADDGTDFKLKENKVDRVLDDPKEGYEFGDYAKNDQVWEGSEVGTTANEYKDIIPDSKLDKNPWFEIKVDVEDPAPNSWIVAKVTGVNDLKTKGVTLGDVGENWAVVSGNAQDGYTFEDVTVDTLVDGAILVYKDQLTQRNSRTNSLFTCLNVSPDFNEAAFGKATKNLVIKGVAVQAVEGDSEDLDETTLGEIMASLPSNF